MKVAWKCEPNEARIGQIVSADAQNRFYLLSQGSIARRT